MMNHLRLFLLLLVPVALVHAGDEKMETITYRVLGLCYPERVDDLRAVLKDRPVTIVGIDYARSEATITHDPKTLSAENLAHTVNAKGFWVIPRSTVPVDQLKRIEIPVTGLDCKGCALGTYNVISRIDGVEQATVSYKDGKVLVLIDPARTSQGALEEALKKGNVTLTGK